MAERLGLANGAEPIIADLIERTPRALDALAKRLPEAFPAVLFDSVSAGMMAAVKRLAREPDHLSEILHKHGLPAYLAPAPTASPAD